MDEKVSSKTGVSDTPGVDSPKAESTVVVLPFRDRHRLSLLLVITVVIAVFMTGVSVFIYNTSGAAQLDLSRPGYQSVSNQVGETDKIDTFSASGPVTADTIKEFMNLYDTQAKKAKAVDAFNGDPLNPEVLEYGTPTIE